MILTFLLASEGRIYIDLQEKEDDLERFCTSLRILTKRDRSKTIVTILRALMHLPPSQPISASSLAQSIALNRITVLHHLSRLQKLGLIKREKGKFYLSDHSFSRFVLKAKQESDRVFEEILKIANKLDQEFKNL